MVTFKNIFDKILEFAVIICAVAMITVVIIQIIYRLPFLMPPVWTEEAARMLFIYMIAFGAGLAFKDGAFTSIDFLKKYLPAIVSKILDFIICAVITILMFIVLISSISFIRVGAKQTSPSLRVKMSYVFTAIFILSFFITFYALIEVLRKLRKLRKTGTDK